MDDKVKELINTIDARKKEYMDKMQDYSASYFNTKIRELDGVLNDIFRIYGLTDENILFKESEQE